MRGKKFISWQILNSGLLFYLNIILFFFRKALLAANMQNGFTWFALSDLMTSGLTL